MSERRRQRGRGRDWDRERALPPQDIIAGRVPSHDLDSEASVISAMVLSQDAIRKVKPILRPEQCYSDSNARIVEAIYTLVDDGQPVDIVTVATWLRERERLQQIGGATYLGQLADATPKPGNVEAHARAVVRMWVKRQTGALGHALAAESYGDVGDVRTWVAAARAKLDELADTGRTHSDEHIRPVLGRVMKDVVALAEQGKRSLGTPTGYKHLDKATAGLFPGRITYIAARPGIGKSSFVRCLAINVAAIEDAAHGVVFIQLEGTREEVGRGLLCSEARVDGLKFAAGIVQPADWARLAESGEFLAQLPIWVEDRSCTVDDIIAIVRRHQAEFNRPATETTREQRIVLVIVDYVQRVKSDESREKRNEELAVISQRLKDDLAKGCNVHVLALAAMNREVEKRKGGRPQLSDIRDCGDLESDADAVLFLDRPRGGDEAGNQRKEPSGDARDPNVATAFFGKNRFGVEGATFKLRFFPDCARFVDLYEGEEPTNGG